MEWERVCASVCAPWRRLRPPPARSRLLAAAGRPFRVSVLPPLLLLHFASSSLCLEPESQPVPLLGTDSSGWKEKPSGRSGAAPGRVTRAPEPGAAERERSGAGVWLVSGEMGDFLK